MATDIQIITGTEGTVTLADGSNLGKVEGVAIAVRTEVMEHTGSGDHNVARYKATKRSASGSLNGVLRKSAGDNPIDPMTANLTVGGTDGYFNNDTAYATLTYVEDGTGISVGPLTIIFTGNGINRSFSAGTAMFSGDFVLDGP